MPKGLRFVEAPIALIAGLGIWRSAFVKQIGAAALIGYSVVDYLDRGEDRGSELRGQLVALLEQLAQRERPYEQIDVLAYSFGSIDALFPFVQSPPPRLATIDRLVTIACPLDFVRSYWPDYFTKRFSIPGRPAQWVNFYAPSDVLASNFQDATSGIVEPTAAGAAGAAISGREQPRVAPDPLNVAYLIDGRDEPVTGSRNRCGSRACVSTTSTGAAASPARRASSTRSSSTSGVRERRLRTPRAAPRGNRARARKRPRDARVARGARPPR
jgi:hypothetical protein